MKGKEDDEGGNVPEISSWPKETWPPPTRMRPAILLHSTASTTYGIISDAFIKSSNIHTAWKWNQFVERDELLLLERFNSATNFVVAFLIAHPPGQGEEIEFYSVPKIRK